jgi:hypothetical protein
MKDDEDYRELSTEEHLDKCAVCGADARLLGVWPRLDSYVVVCTTGEAIGPQDPEFLPGCPMYLPRREFHQPTLKQATEFWNSFTQGLLYFRRHDGS